MTSSLARRQSSCSQWVGSHRGRRRDVARPVLLCRRLARRYSHHSSRAPSRQRGCGSPGERYFRDGDRVLHASFGEGIVVTSKLTRHDEEVTIAFAGSGVKTLAASIANLEVQG